MGDHGLQGETAMEQTCDEDTKTAATTTTAGDLLLPEVVELSTVNPELTIDASCADWLTSLLRYDDENANSGNS